MDESSGVKENSKIIIKGLTVLRSNFYLLVKYWRKGLLLPVDLEIRTLCNSVLWQYIRFNIAQSGCHSGKRPSHPEFWEMIRVAC